MFLNESTLLRLQLKMGQKESSVYRKVPEQVIKLDLFDADSSEEEELYNADDDESEEDGRLLPGHQGLNVMVEKNPGLKEPLCSLILQIFIPFTIAGYGMVAAGMVLDQVQHWTVFLQIQEIFILVPALLGLKGNLEMTLASRLSTAANLNKMETRSDSLALIIGNLALVQCQGIVVGFLAALTGVGMGWSTTGSIQFQHVLLLCASSVVTASLASFVLGLVMIVVILLSRRCNVNPDNVATPIAASLGDLTTLSLLAWIASLLWADLQEEQWLAPFIIVAYILLIPCCAWLAFRCPETKPVLLTGWFPVLIAMLVSSGGGLILDFAVVKFPGIAVFQPVMNGAGGNLVAVQASRMSTQLHVQSSGKGPGKLQSDEKVCVNPCSVLFSDNEHSRTACVLLMLVIPGHLMFVYTISYLEAGHTTPTPTFLLFYLLASWFQVALLLYTCRLMVFGMWRAGIDPDNSAIPYLTALGDLLGGAFLGLAFQALDWVGREEFNNGFRASLTDLTTQASQFANFTVSSPLSTIPNE